MKILLKTNDKVFIQIDNRIISQEGNSTKTEFIKFLLKEGIIKPARGKKRVNIGSFNITNLYFFLHTSDFGYESSTHFEIEVDNTKSIMRFFSEISETDNQTLYSKFFEENNIKLKILWFKHEARSCTVFGPLLAAIENYEKDEDDDNFEKALLQIFKIHDIEERKNERMLLIDNFIKNMDLNNSIEKCNKHEI